ncbi:hypothetical protein NQ318_019173 [Aromia moschata]|uniref:C2H2-type domain-containing protein n=1 Tax=Aromia moschata TaxID=1265417 RepID=A0AAV8YTG4_9CUCU|nr:hypothetical protein NQ318_019173 [Aromia moschata]
MEFLFDQNSCESKENYHAPLRDNNGNIIPKKKLKINTNSRDNGGCSRSPSASSEDSTENLCVVKRKIKRKKGLLEKRRHYRINITKLKNQQSLDENSGEFYICHCREKYKSSNALQKSDLRIITSDTESCSDTGKTLLMPTVETKIFCNKCGSGYNNRNELMAHMQIHETFCRLCNESFGCEFTFREHMRLHIFKVYMCHICNKEFPFKELLQMHFEYHMEDRTLETVLDMEEEYRVHRCNFMAKNYSTSINSILCFLSENHDIHYYSYKFMKVVCDICFHEVFFCDYEHHLQSVHYPYTY